jgi:hypothetical protein
MAEEALAMRIAGMTAAGEAIPLPSPLDKILGDPENQEAAAFLAVRALEHA